LWFLLMLVLLPLLLLLVLQLAGIPVSSASRMLGCMFGPDHQQVLDADLALTSSIGVQTSCTIQVGPPAQEMDHMLCSTSAGVGTCQPVRWLGQSVVVGQKLPCG
jgi:hypothetical protein